MVRFRELARRDRLLEEFNSARTALGNTANKVGPTEAARCFRTSRGRARYWRKKVNSPEHHAGTRGGRRKVKFSDEYRSEMIAQIHAIVAEQPLTSVSGYMKHFMETIGISPSHTYVKELIKSLGYTYGSLL
jgi:hypothetical protein